MCGACDAPYRTSANVGQNVTTENAPSGGKSRRWNSGKQEGPKQQAPLPEAQSPDPISQYSEIAAETAVDVASVKEQMDSLNAILASVKGRQDVTSIRVRESATAELKSLRIAVTKTRPLAQQKKTLDELVVRKRAEFDTLEAALTVATANWERARDEMQEALAQLADVELAITEQEVAGSLGSLDSSHFLLLESAAELVQPQYVSFVKQALTILQGAMVVADEPSAPMEVEAPPPAISSSQTPVRTLPSGGALTASASVTQCDVSPAASSVSSQVVMLDTPIAVRHSPIAQFVTPPRRQDQLSQLSSLSPGLQGAVTPGASLAPPITQLSPLTPSGTAQVPHLTQVSPLTPGATQVSPLTPTQGSPVPVASPGTSSVAPVPPAEHVIASRSPSVKRGREGRGSQGRAVSMSSRRRVQSCACVIEDPYADVVIDQDKGTRSSYAPATQPFRGRQFRPSPF